MNGKEGATLISLLSRNGFGVKFIHEQRPKSVAKNVDRYLPVIVM